ncbi:hypothetical protein MRX96_057240 [Rhipicephalus microplus]
MPHHVHYRLVSAAVSLVFVDRLKAVYAPAVSMTHVPESSLEGQCADMRPIMGARRCAHLQPSVPRRKAVVRTLSLPFKEEGGYARESGKS